MCFVVKTKEIQKWTHMIRAYKTRLLPISRCNKRGMMATHIVKSMNLAIIISTHQKLYIPQSAIYNWPSISFSETMNKRGGRKKYWLEIEMHIKTKSAFNDFRWFLYESNELVTHARIHWCQVLLTGKLIAGGRRQLVSNPASIQDAGGLVKRRDIPCRAAQGRIDHIMI